MWLFPPMKKPPGCGGCSGAWSTRLGVAIQVVGSGAEAGGVFLGEAEHGVAMAAQERADLASTQRDAPLAIACREPAIGSRPAFFSCTKAEAVC